MDGWSLPEARAPRPGDRLQQRLRHAIEAQQFELVYQPIYAARSQRLLAAEALLRWHEPQLGPVSPGVFIPVAERSTLILQIDQFVLSSVIAQLRAWREAGLPSLPVSVNLSARQLQSSGFAARLEAMLGEAGVAPQLLQLEITEHALIDDRGRAARNLLEGAELGLSFALDDFGTGQSSFSQLRHLPIQRLKIDREFVDGIDADPRDQKIVRAIVAMAHALGVDVVAEGVETEAEMNTLRRVRCDALQGFLLGRPMSAESLAGLLAAPAA
ncbi:putative bifunctional diguanylate cyclase/phosphodiesterase [Solimonas sp. K1W22B-7]|uniref:putative bifunctional diguanylate cyclase/phosphodiesterase n=1 Tax=Solimonas sp. K1W22B-7 TaxID=2303331 RepID=UPI0013C5149B|nr:EAL domain-containing protein [Solimonas sp. K1W22B-7]